MDRNKIFISLVALFISVILIIIISNNSTEIDTIYNNSSGDSNVTSKLDIENDIFKNVILKGNYIEEYSDVNCYEINKFLGSAIYYLRSDSEKSNPIPIIPGYSENQDIILKLLYLDKSYLDYYAISVSMEEDNVYTFAMIKPVNGYEEYVLNAFQNRLFDIERVVEYNPQFKVDFDNYIYEQVGQFIILIVCEDTYNTFEKLYDVLVSGDLTEIENYVT